MPAAHASTARAALRVRSSWSRGRAARARASRSALRAPSGSTPVCRLARHTRGDPRGVRASGAGRCCAPRGARQSVQAEPSSRAQPANLTQPVSVLPGPHSRRGRRRACARYCGARTPRAGETHCAEHWPGVRPWPRPSPRSPGARRSFGRSANRVQSVRDSRPSLRPLRSRDPGLQPSEDGRVVGGQRNGLHRRAEPCCFGSCTAAWSLSRSQFPDAASRRTGTTFR